MAINPNSPDLLALNNQITEMRGMIAAVLAKLMNGNGTKAERNSEGWLVLAIILGATGLAAYGTITGDQLMQIYEYIGIGYLAARTGKKVAEIVKANGNAPSA